MSGSRYVITFVNWFNVCFFFLSDAFPVPDKCAGTVADNN